ncbi:MAG TPA: RHS repeat-associated core domain-containing protein, partial [Ktedonobacteraceae bacterium]|nr:RHS repeat-associated core domain-containing protein [Ktedonobacteraceae bacterium]
YDDLGGQLLDERSGSTTTLLLTDALGSVIATLSNTQNNAAVLGNQLYGPYGNQRLQAGTIDTSTTRGFTGQYNDTVTGLDYYGARYYDPAAGVFLAADNVQGNAVSMNPYGYVGGNPETMTDPTGQVVVSEGNAAAEAEAYLESYQQGLADAESFSYQDTTIADETASSGNTTYSLDSTTGDITQTIVNPDGSSTTTSFYPTDTGYQKAAWAFSNPASDGQLHPVNGGILAAQYGIHHKPGAGELPSGSTKGSQPGKGPQPQAGNGGQGSKPPTTKPTAPSPDGPRSGRANPQNLRHVQDTCTNQGDGYTVEGNIAGLKAGTISPDDFPPAKIFQKTPEMNWGSQTKFGRTGSTDNLVDGEWYTLDHRRIYAFQEAGITDAPIIDVSSELDRLRDQTWKFTTENGGTSIELLGGSGGC